MEPASPQSADLVSRPVRSPLTWLAGILYAGIIGTSILNMVLVESRLVVPGDAAATVARLAADPGRFRAGLVYDTLMFAGVIALAWALFALLRPFAPGRALLAMLWRVAEAVAGVGTVLLGLVVVVLVESVAGQGADPPVPAVTVALVESLLAARELGYSLVLIFLSLGTLLFCQIMFAARAVPRWLAGLGLVAFALMLGATLISLVAPAAASWTMIAWSPGIVFEVGIGLWLMARGLPHPASAATAAADLRPAGAPVLAPGRIASAVDGVTASAT